MHVCFVSPLGSLPSSPLLLLLLPAFPFLFITPESPYPVVLGSSITLTCTSHGMGAFNLTWSVNGILLARAEEVNTSLSLTVDLISTDNYTSYTCTSQNRDGVNSTSVTLEQAGTATVCVMGCNEYQYCTRPFHHSAPCCDSGR